MGSQPPPLLDKNTRIKQVKAALKNVLCSMTVAGGYSMAIDSTHFYPVYSQQFTTGEDRAFPKFFLAIDGGRNEGRPDEGSIRTITFVFAAAVKQVSSSGASPLDVVEDLIDDVDLIIRKNDTLQGTVIDATLRDFDTDSGEANSCAVAIMQIECQYFRQS
jgi:hypothetical protein